MAIEMEKTNTEKVSAKIPTTLMDYLKAMGPGIIYIMGLFAVGDMTVAAKGGSDFRYSFMWAFTLGTLAIVALSMPLSRYTMATGEGIFKAYRRISIPWTLGCTFALVFMPINWHGYMWMAVGSASSGIIQGITGTGIPLQIPIIVFWLLGLYPVYYKRYDLLENMAKILLTLLFIVVAFVSFQTNPNWGEVVKGAIVPTMTKEMLPIILATFGATAAAIVCWNYSYCTSEKGWNSPKYEKVMNFDLLLSAAFMMIIAVLLTVVSTEVLNTAGISAKSANDMAKPLGMVLGKAGFIAYFVGMIAAAYSSIIAYSYIMSYMVIDSLGLDINSEKGKKIYKWLSMFLYTAPILFTLVPSALSLVSYTIAVNVVSNLFTLIPLVMILILGNREKYAPNSEAFAFYKIRPWENAVLIVFLVLIVWLFSRYVVATFFS